MAEPTVHGPASCNPPAANLDGSLFGQFVLAVSGMLPALEHIKTTIAESSGQIPRASVQLHNVTKATESATLEILNVLDSMTLNVDEAEAGLKALDGLLPNPGSRVADVMNGIAKSLATTKAKSMNIAMALQVQDITSQQIAGVSHMIESVQSELIKILDQFGEASAHAAVAPVTRPQHFDGTAEYSDSTVRQEQADSIINQWTSGHHE